MEKLYVIKIGGNVVDDPATLAQLLVDIATFEGSIVLVHGGGKRATRLAEQLAIPQTLIDGRRITDAATLDVAVMVYAGLINKQIVAGLQAAGRNAIGLSGTDGNAILATRRPPVPVDYGYVGDLKAGSVNTTFFGTLIQAGLTPVFSAITHDGAGGLLNTNADTIASAIAVAMAATYQTHLVYLFEKKGVLRDVADDGSLLAKISVNVVEQLIAEGAIVGGMIPKIRMAAQAVAAGVATVSIGKASELSAILNDEMGCCTRVYL